MHFHSLLSSCLVLFLQLTQHTNFRTQRLHCLFLVPRYYDLSGTTMGRIKRSRPETTVHKAARKARKQEKRVEGLDPAALIPIIVPGTHTAVNQLPQARRWLQDELELTIPRFSKISIRAVELLCHKRQVPIEALNCFRF